MRGRKPKPTHLKLVTGNPGKRPLNKNEPQPTRQLPSPPAILSGEARTEWRRVAKELHSLGLLTSLDRAVLAAYCQAYGRWVRAERVLREMAKSDPLTHGLLIKATSGNAAQNPLVLTARQAMAAAMAAASELGMTPSARTRLSGTPALDSGNPFSEF